jgi:hypothetical protein
LVLGQQVVNHLLLLPIDPAGKDDEIQLPGLENEIHNRHQIDISCGAVATAWIFK